MSEAKSGDKVQIHYTGKLEDGTTFDTSEGRDPFEFEVGSGEVIAGFDEAVRGMSEGDTKSVTVDPNQGYGDRHEQLVQRVPKSALPDGLEPQVGMTLQGKTPDGQLTQLTVTGVDDEHVTVDANHPLAGQKLDFDIELLKIL